MRFAIDRAGLVGADGPTHAGSFDLAYLGCLPDFVIMAPSDEAELMHMVATAAVNDDRPSAFAIRAVKGSGYRYPRAAMCSISARAHRAGGEPDCAALARYASAGSSQGCRRSRAPRTFDDRCGRAFHEASRHRPHSPSRTRARGTDHGRGRISRWLQQPCSARSRLCRPSRTRAQVRPVVLPDRFLDHDKPERMYAAAGLNSSAIVMTALSALGRSDVQWAAAE